MHTSGPTYTTPASGTGRDLRALFDPASVAIVGASDDERKWGNWLAVQALRMRHRRRVHLVNRRGGQVLGEPALRRLDDAGEAVELAVIAVPATGFDQAVDEALTAGARAIIAITAGFAEHGEAGRRRQVAVVSRVREAGAVLLGPNCLGAFDSGSELHLLGNPMPAGSVGLVSQSGNLALELGHRLEVVDMGFSRMASLGNQADLTVADLVRDFTSHPQTHLVAVYCEDFADGRDFVDACAAAAMAGTPVVVCSVGASAASRRGAASHTGALTTGSAVLDAACRAAGAVRVASVRQMADALRVLHRFRPDQVRTTAIVSDGGGHASIAADLAVGHGLDVPELDPTVRDRLRAQLPASSSVSNPVDLAGAGEQDVRSFARTLDTVLSSPGVDAALVTGYFGGFGEYGAQLAADEVDTARRMARLATATGKPVLVHTMFPAGATAQTLESGGVPVFDAADDAVAALTALARRGRPRPMVLPVPAPPVTADDYRAARDLFRGAGLSFPPATFVQTVPEAVDAARDLGLPVVVKALGLRHKSDAGGVRLGLRTLGAVRRACQDMSARLRPPGFSVEAMVDTADAVELIVGARQDKRFGPIGMVGLGGVYAETFRDVAFDLAPMTTTTGRRLLDSLSCAPLLRGARGRPPVDVDAAVQAVVTVTNLAAAHPEIGELEVNPLLVTPRGALGLDARVVLAS